MVKTKALELSNFVNKVISIARRDSLFVTVVKSLIDLSATIGKEHGVQHL